MVHETRDKMSSRSENTPLAQLKGKWRVEINQKMHPDTFDSLVCVIMIFSIIVDNFINKRSFEVIQLLKIHFGFSFLRYKNIHLLKL